MLGGGANRRYQLVPGGLRAPRVGTEVLSSGDMVHLKSATPEVRLYLYEGAGLEVQVMPLGTFARAHEPPMRNKDTISTQ
eukprot:COSAG02_NODE_1101_length_14572_cov_10.347267_4_plen_80_part_00